MNIAENTIDQPLNQSTFSSSKSSEWFDELVASIRTHQVMLETDTADKKRKAFYELMINGSEKEVAAIGHNITTVTLVKSMFLEYLKEIDERKINFEDIAFDNTNSGLLVWAVVADDDEDAADQLLLAAAKVNAKYNNYGFSINSIILEKSDEHPIPKHYQSLLVK